MKPSRGRGRQKADVEQDQRKFPSKRKSSDSKGANSSKNPSKPKGTDSNGPKSSNRGKLKGPTERVSRFSSGAGGFKRPFKDEASGESPRKRGYEDKYSERKFSNGRKPYRSRPSERTESRKSTGDRRIRLNRFLSNAGIASRREADQLIELGLVQVNGKVVREMGVLVDPQTDTVKYDDRVLRPEKFRYVLLNKPKDFITTGDDPLERRTVMELVSKACKERIYPVGRLDRQTTGLLLFTNDGDMARKLTHPKLSFPKLYHIETTSKVKPEHLDAWRKGIQLEDGLMKADEVSFVDGDLCQVGMKIRSGKNRVVRRLFEHFGYTVRKLDRVMLGSLTKKDLPRGRYRHLTDQEVAFLKMMK